MITETSAAAPAPDSACRQDSRTAGYRHCGFEHPRVCPWAPPKHFARGFTLIALLTVGSWLASGYSVLTHEQVVDLMWKDQLQPLLLKRFPSATEEDLQKAHAYNSGWNILSGPRLRVVR
jgi:hypothetical protein